MSARLKSSRTSKPGLSKSRISSKKSNAAGYAKRHAQKSSLKDKATASFDDVYEYAPSKVRRAKIGLELDEEEAVDRHRYASDDGVDLGGMGQEGREGLRARLLGEHKDDEQVDSGDDEDIASDDAFEESDEEKYAGFDFSSKRTKAGPSLKKDVRKSHKNIPEVNLNEDSDDVVSDADSADKLEQDEDEEMEDGDAENFFDILEVFDGKADSDDDAPAIQSKENIKAPMSGSSNDASELEEDAMSEDEQDEQEEHYISASDREASPEALAELESFLSKLDPAEGKKRKSDDPSATQSLLKKRRLMEERTEAGAEGEFGVSAAAGSSALNLDDLLAPLASSSALTALKKSTRVLTSTSNKTKTLSAPLPQRAQERLDREAAYEQTKEEVDKWSATMKRIKQAEHLSFPLQAQSEGRVSNLELAAKFKPSNELESAVDKLLKSAQLRDEDIAGTEALKMAHLSVEEVEARRAELRIMRELAFRADRKAKRIAKIKSKTYRRIRKKQRERLGADGGDEEDEEEDAEARLKAETERARERATLRHKNTGKWAKAMQGREGLDVDQRQAIGEMLERGEKLRRRIQGEVSGDESEESDSDDGEQDVETIKQGAFEELATLNTSEIAASPDLKSRGVFNMKFMRDAAARQTREADADADDFVKEMGGEQGSDAEDGASGEAESTEGPSVQRVGGRVSYHPGTSISTISSKPLGSRASEASSVTLQSADLVQDDLKASDLVSSPTISIAAEASNPWLVASSSSGPSRKRSEVVVQKGSDAIAKSTNKLKKRAAKGEMEQERVRDDAVLEIDASKVLTVVEPASAPATEREPRGKKKTKNASVTVQPPVVTAGGDAGAHADESDGHSEVDEQENALEKKQQGAKGRSVAAFKQRELVSLAFAGDNVVQAFEDLKQKEIEEDAPREVDTTLPGWGAWGGTGAKKLPPRPNLIKKIAGVDPSSRADYKKAHVIISERRDKKAAKYLVKELPFPYTSHAQYARSMDTPIGAEWNTRVGFQRGTLPRVVKKMGTVIEPLQKPS